MATTMKSAKGPSPGHEQDYEGLERVEQCKALVCARAISQWLAGRGATRRRRSWQQWRRRGALLLANWRGEEARRKQVSELSGSNGLTSGGSAGVQPPNGVRDLSFVGHD